MLSVLAQAVQSWKSAKAIALLAVVALAIGIGSTTAIYTVVNTILLAPLPYPDGERFVVLYSARFTEPNLRGANGVRDLLEYQQRATAFDAFGWFRLGSTNLTAPGPPQHVQVVSVTPSLAHNLGVQPLVGQWFTNPTDVVISHLLWQRLGGDRSIVGKPVTLDGQLFTITGVMPPAFRFPIVGPGTEGIRTDVWRHLNPTIGEQDDWAYFAYARRKPGVSLANAEAEVKRIAADIAAANPVSHQSYTARLDDLKFSSIETIRPTLVLLFVASLLLLAITCANVAALLVARSVARARETATRVALGASQIQLGLHYFVESFVLSAVGATLGALVGVALVRTVVSIAPQEMPRPDEILVDWTVFAFGVGAALAASALSSLAPLRQALRTSPNEVLNAGVRASASAHARAVSRALVVAEIALAFTLLAVGAVLVSQMRALLRTSPGFDADGLLTFELTLPDTVLGDDDTRTAFQKRLVEAVQSVPGVTDAAFANQMPLDGCCLGGTIYPEGRSPDAPVERISFVIAESGFTRAMGIPMIAGRLPIDAEMTEELLAVAINEEAARRFWSDRNPIDAYGRINDPHKGTRFRVVGVVGDIRNNGLNNPPVAELYLLSTITAVNPLQFVVRSALPASTVVPELRRAIAGVDPALPLHDAKSMGDIIAASLVLQRVSSFIVTSFALAALLMATLGVYGLVSYGVRQRRIEIGTRMALGALKQDVLALVLGGGARMAAYGVALGSLAVFAATGLLVRFLDVKDFDWLPFVMSATIVVAVVALASSVPAWRATHLSPMVAIRDEPESTWQQAARSVRLALKELPQLIAGREEPVFISEGLLLAEFAAAARGAESFTDAIRVAVTTLRTRLGATSASLVEKTAGQEYRTLAVAPVESVQLSLPEDGYLHQRLSATFSPLSLSADDLAALARWAEAHRPSRVAEFTLLAKAGVRLAVALRVRSEIVGMLWLGPPDGRGSYGDAEKRLLTASASQFALMIENARLTDRVVEQEKLRRDLALAAEVQRRLLPEHPPETSVAAIAAMSVPARTVGGDYYDFVDLGAKGIGLALADVAGKGIAAALIMSVVQASLRMIASEGDVSLPQLAARMNQFLHRSTASNSYATFFYAQIDEQTRQLRYVNAGHNPPYLIRSLDIEELSTGGVVIGLFPDAEYEEGMIDLESGDVLLAFTDGVTEALNANEEEFGNDRLKALLRRLVHLPVQEISWAIRDELRAWIEDADQYDDLTFVVMKVN